LNFSDRELSDLFSKKQFLEAQFGQPTVNLHMAEPSLENYEKIVSNLMQTSAELDDASKSITKSKSFLSMKAKAITKSMKNYEDIAHIFRNAASSATSSSFTGSSLIDRKVQSGEPHVNVVLRSSDVSSMEKALLTLKDKEQKRLMALRS
jgi:hypothetical protein